MKKILRALLAFCAASVFCLLPLGAAAYAYTEDNIIPKVTIAAPWDSGIIVTLTDVYEIFTDFRVTGEIGIMVVLSDSGSFSFSEDVIASRIGEQVITLEANRRYSRSTFEWFDVVEAFTVGEPDVWEGFFSGYPMTTTYLMIATDENPYRNSGSPINIRDIALTVTDTVETTAATTQANNTHVTFNGEPLNFTLPIINRSDRTFYPMRELFEAIGAEVAWNQETRTAIGILGENRVEFPANSNIYYINGETHRMDDGLTVFIENDRTYIPVRFAAESLGLGVGWDAATNTISIISGF